MKSIITLFIIMIFSSVAVNAQEITTANIEQENLLVLKSVQGGQAKEACSKKHSVGDSNTILRAVQKCITDGIQVVDKEQTNLNVSQFCNLKPNQIKYGFTSDNKCKRKFVDVIADNWILF
ncbi:MAG: hypothetical protein PQ612_02640 [Rickettsiales bacterium]|nr:hypothetical protein [Pseudomonadota bacterium]MDA0965989.1 hypothetical protein [Pseudomonadota bacterium]MDG4542540.1 hypothetical protein [Rickettsiales bacterium]MDG4545044.1 hypothetical protein [Rickettsiales bacterium]MDG4547167.1 hypothetical protein [Rickettsiales bacterium]